MFPQRRIYIYIYKYDVLAAIRSLNLFLTNTLYMSTILNSYTYSYFTIYVEFLKKVLFADFLYSI